MKTRYEKPVARSLGEIQDAEGLCGTGTGAYGTVCVTGAADARCGTGGTPGSSVPTYCTGGGEVALCINGNGAFG